MCGEADPVGDIAAVEALAFQQLEPALDDTVGVRGTVAGAHVREMGPGCEPVVAIDCTAGPLMLLWPNPSTNSYIPPSKTVLRRPLEPGAESFFHYGVNPSGAFPRKSPFDLRSSRHSRRDQALFALFGANQHLLQSQGSLGMGEWQLEWNPWMFHDTRGCK